MALGTSVGSDAPVFAYALYGGAVLGRAPEVGWAPYLSLGFESSGRRGGPDTGGLAIRGGLSLSGGRGEPGGMWPDLILYGQVSGFLRYKSLRSDYKLGGVRAGVGLTGMWLRALCRAERDAGSSAGACLLVGYLGLINHVQVQYEWAHVSDTRAPLNPYSRDESRWLFLAGFGL